MQLVQWWIGTCIIYVWHCPRGPVVHEVMYYLCLTLCTRFSSEWGNVLCMSRGWWKGCYQLLYGIWIYRAGYHTVWLKEHDGERQSHIMDDEWKTVIYIIMLNIMKHSTINICLKIWISQVKYQCMILWIQMVNYNLCSAIVDKKGKRVHIYVWH